MTGRAEAAVWQASLLELRGWAWPASLATVLVSLTVQRIHAVRER